MCIALINKMSGNEQKGSEILSVPNDYFFTVAQHWPPVNEKSYICHHAIV